MLTMIQRIVKKMKNPSDYQIEEYPDGKGRTRHGSPRFYDLLGEMAEVHDRKSHDYASNDNPYGNYHFAGLVSSLFSHSPNDAGFAGRIAEKMYRLANLESGGKIPQNESIDDTERDIAVITALWMADRRDRRAKENCMDNKDLEMYVIKNESRFDTLNIERAISYLTAVIDVRRRDATNQSKEEKNSNTHK